MAYSEITSWNHRFSVIVPLYNKEPYVEKALRSVLGQTFSDFELIVVNDGSKDNSLAVAQKVLVGVENAEIINQENAGVSTARNNGIAVSHGEYICFLDADDWWEPTFLEEMNKLIECYPDAGLYASNYIYYKPGKTHIAINHPTGYINYPKLYFENGDMPIWTGAVCLPKTSSEKYRGFPIRIKLGEDFLLWSKIAIENKIAFLNKPLAYYNNEIPPSQRATRHLYPPEHHMLFNMGWLEKLVAEMKDNKDWINLMDMLRVNGLLDYWLSKEYHQSAAVELKKVDWDKQQKSVIRQYKKPIWVMRLKSRFMKFGSFIKHLFI